MAARSVVAMLPSGRAVWMRLEPAPAPVRDVDRLVASIERTSTSRVHTLRSNANAAAAHKGAVRRSAAEASRMLLHAQRRLLRRMARADTELDRRIDRRLLPVIDRARAQQEQRGVLARSSARRDLWNQAVVVTALPLMAAFGQRDNPFAQENLVIVASALVFLFGDEVSDLLAGKRGLLNGPVRGADLWSYAAPFANVLSVWWLLGGRQHERFITGEVDLPAVRPGENGIAVFSVRSGNRQTDTCWAVVDLSSRIASERLESLVLEEDGVALVTLRSLDANPDLAGIQPNIELIRAQVRQEVLWVVVIVASVVAVDTPPFDPPPLLARVRFGWLVDSRPPSPA